MKQREVVWKSLEYPGMEHLYLREQRKLVQAVSTVIGVVEQSPFRLDYVIRCEPNYAVRQVTIRLSSGQGFTLTSDGRGNWLDRMQTPLPELAGCIDVDISATPFTNTLPIRRLQWQVRQSETFKLVYILVPELKVSVMRQRYTCLKMTGRGAAFRYENVDDDFSADVTVDNDGLVLSYPGLFERVI